MTPVMPPRELVLASAGSGKTFRVSSRLIGLLAYGEEPDRLLAATFTRKAAGEILDRVLKRLAAAVIDPEVAKELSAHASFYGDEVLLTAPEFWAGVLERVVSQLHRFNVGTLDAFFIRAASAYGQEIGLPAGWRIPDVPAIERLRSEALLEVLRGIERDRLLELLRLSARGDSRRSVHERLGRMMDELVQIQEQIDPLADDPWGYFADAGPVIVGEDPESLARELESAPLPTKQDGSDKRNWRTQIDRAVHALRVGDWAGLAGLTLCQRVASGHLEYDRSAIDPPVLDILERVVIKLRAELRPRLGAQIRALGHLTEAFEGAYRELQKAAGLYTFSDITRLIGETDRLGTRDELYYRLDAHARHILLDEFQDTSLGQWEVLAPIVDEVLSDDGRAAVIVADPKQSIYGWRGAEPILVHSLEDHYSLPRHELTQSYRSSQIVLDLVNRAFTEIAANPVLQDDGVCEAAAEAWGRDFAPHQTALDLPGYVALEVGPGDDGQSSRRPRHYRHAAARIAELRKECQGFTIGVLTRTNAAVARLFVELRRIGVEVSQEGGTPLTDSAACEAIVSLLRLADHPAETVARYHVASSPLGPLFAFRDHLDAAAAESLARRLRKELISDGYGPTLTRLARKLAPHCDARDARRLFQLTELAHRYDERATLRPADFVRILESERVDDRTAASVRVMTVHQAKGLEFDIVVLPQLDDSIFKGGRHAPAATLRSRPGGRVTAVLPRAGKEMRCLFRELEAAEEQRKSAVVRDALSTLYVATTRAVYAQYSILCPDGPNGPGAGVTPARILREALAEAAEGPLPPAVSGDVLFEHGDRRWFEDPRARPTAEQAGEPEWTVPILSHAPRPRRRLLKRERPSGLHEEGTRVRDLLRIEKAESLDRGSIVHAWFERIGWIEDASPPDALLGEVARRISPDIHDDTVRALIAEFNGWLLDPAIREVLSVRRYGTDAGTLTLERELPFVRRSGDAIMEGVIDRVVLVRSPSGEAVRAEIIDFKTDKVESGEAKVVAFAERYRAQLGAYVDAVVELYGVPRQSCTATLLLLGQQRAVPVVTP